MVRGWRGGGGYTASTSAPVTSAAFKVGRASPSEEEERDEGGGSRTDSCARVTVSVGCEDAGGNSTSNYLLGPDLPASRVPRTSSDGRPCCTADQPITFSLIFEHFLFRCRRCSESGNFTRLAPRRVSSNVFSPPAKSRARARLNRQRMLMLQRRACPSRRHCPRRCTALQMFV